MCSRRKRAGDLVSANPDIAKERAAIEDTMSVKMRLMDARECLRTLRGGTGLCELAGCERDA